MGQPTPPTVVLPITAVFSRYDEALAWARERMTAAWGPLALESEPFAFDQTHYYDATMGPGLKKPFYAMERLADPAELAAWKLQTNAWEEEYASLGRHPEPRPLNLDPGYLTLGKLVLASTKDFTHRIYLGRGIYAEITLYYKHRAWQHHDWTFADYRRADYQAFFSRCRDYLHQRLRREPST